MLGFGLNRQGHADRMRHHFFFMPMQRPVLAITRGCAMIALLKEEPGPERREWLDVIEQVGHSIFRLGQSLIFHPRLYETTCLALQSPI